MNAFAHGRYKGLRGDVQSVGYLGSECKYIFKGTIGGCLLDMGSSLPLLIVGLVLRLMAVAVLAGSAAESNST